ncbi:hypothetical protein BB561_004712 [Smittium simulii]|uniref:TEA domain-containing protein n=1 Tax=Smittium simulii TaxID=133385 RepID=A0A2T9YER7_9FUNG|nr:hypothetical protein BB561_004712 [Smittium simulii]
MEIKEIKEILSNLNLEEYNKAAGRKIDGEVWTETAEFYFLIAIDLFSQVGQKKYQLDVNSKELIGRNDIISRYIFMRSNIYRARKQVSSHIQVWANCKKAPCSRDMDGRIFHKLAANFKTFYVRVLGGAGSKRGSLKRSRDVTSSSGLPTPNSARTGFEYNQKYANKKFKTESGLEGYLEPPEQDTLVPQALQISSMKKAVEVLKLTEDDKSYLKILFRVGMNTHMNGISTESTILVDSQTKPISTFAGNLRPRNPSSVAAYLSHHPQQSHLYNNFAVNQYSVDGMFQSAQRSIQAPYTVGIPESKHFNFYFGNNNQSDDFKSFKGETEPIRPTVSLQNITNLNKNQTMNKMLETNAQNYIYSQSSVNSFDNQNQNVLLQQPTFGSMPISHLGNNGQVFYDLDGLTGITSSNISAQMPSEANKFATLADLNQDGLRSDDTAHSNAHNYYSTMGQNAQQMHGFDSYFDEQSKNSEQVIFKILAGLNDKSSLVSVDPSQNMYVGSKNNFTENINRGISMASNNTITAGNVNSTLPKTFNNQPVAQLTNSSTNIKCVSDPNTSQPNNIYTNYLPLQPALINDNSLKEFDFSYTGNGNLHQNSSNLTSNFDFINSSSTLISPEINVFDSPIFNSKPQLPEIDYFGDMYNCNVLPGNDNLLGVQHLSTANYNEQQMNDILKVLTSAINTNSDSKINSVQDDNNSSQNVLVQVPDRAPEILNSVGAEEWINQVSNSSNTYENVLHSLFPNSGNKTIEITNNDFRKNLATNPNSNPSQLDYMFPTIFANTKTANNNSSHSSELWKCDSNNKDINLFNALVAQPKTN